MEKLTNRLFISQPMRGKTQEDILKERNEAIERCKDLYKDSTIEPLESFYENGPKGHPLWYLGESIKMLEDADIVYMCKNWQQYNGCVIEHECAVRYNKMIVYA